MNKIVREHYPVENLPEDLRQGLPPLDFVTVTLEVRRERVAQSRAKKKSDPDFFRRLRSKAPPPARTIKDINQYISELRDD